MTLEEARRISEMAIKSVDGSKTTPKKLAAELIMDGISVTRGYWLENIDNYDYATGKKIMTDREIRSVNDQLRKLGDRIARMLGYTESWSS